MAEQQARWEIHPSVRGSLDNFVEFIKKHRDLHTADIGTMARVLDTLGEQPRYQVNVHWQDIGWYALSGAQNDGDALSLDFGARYLVRPTLLKAHYFPKGPIWSFLRMSYNGLEPSGVYEYDDGDCVPSSGNRPSNEEYVIDHGRLLPRWCWDEGRTPDDQALSSNARLVVRELAAGNFMIVPKGNPLNSVQLDRYRNDIAIRGDDSPVLKELEKEFGS